MEIVGDGSRSAQRSVGLQDGAQPLFASNIIARRKKLRQPERQQVVDGEINGGAAVAAVGD
jgi:hypothetical protein